MKHSSSRQVAIEKTGTRRRLTVCAALISALMGAIVLSLAACRGGASGDSNAKPSAAAPTAARDAYDLSEMDFKSPDAKNARPPLHS